MKPVKMPRNPYLDENSKKILNETFEFDQLEHIFSKFRKEGKEISDEHFEELVSEVYEWAISSLVNLTGEKELFEHSVDKMVLKKAKNLIEKNPLLKKLLLESGIEMGQKITFSRFKELVSSEKIKELSSNPDNQDLVYDFIRKARERNYTAIAGKNKIIRNKIDTIYNISSKTYTEEHVEQVNIVFSSELYNRIISSIQNYRTISDSLLALIKRTANQDRTYLNNLRSSYVLLYNESEIFIKLLFAMIKISRGEKVDPKIVLNDNVGNLIKSINSRFPELIELNPTIRNAANHSSGVRYQKMDEEIVFSDKDKPPLILKKREFIRECKRAAYTAFSLLVIQQIQYIFAFDVMLDKFEKQRNSTS